MTAKIFIDGQAGTTGLKIYDHLKSRRDIALLQIPERDRKNPAAKQTFLNEADLVVLCLPDDAAKATVAQIPAETKVLDASSAHRTATGWTYGLPELDRLQPDKIRTSTRVSNPGCYPTGFILALRPLIARGIVPADYPASVNAVSGYSGGGRDLINKYQALPCTPGEDVVSFRPYALHLKHKHVPEMQQYTGLKHAPLFSPAVGNFAQGMLVSIPLAHSALSAKTDAERIHATLADYYRGERFVQVMPFGASAALQDGFLSPLGCNDTNNVELFVFGHETQTLLIARLDNLGKGASLAAVQNIELMLGLTDTRRDAAVG